MSESINIITKKKITPDNYFDELMKLGEKICVISDEFPCLKLGNFSTSLRGIEISEIENGYEIRICTFASIADYQLFRKSIDIIKKITGGKVEYEGEIINRFDSYKQFDDKWLYSQLEMAIDVSTILAKQSDNPIVYFGMFAPFCFGKKMMKKFGIENNKPNETDIFKIRKYFRDMQWFLEDKTSTKSNLVIQDDDGKQKSISLIAIKNNKVSDFDFISYAEMILFHDLDNQKFAIMPFEESINKIPKEKYSLLDECQMLMKEPLTTDEIRKIIAESQK